MRRTFIDPVRILNSTTARQVYRALVAGMCIVTCFHAHAAPCRVLDPDLVGAYEGGCAEGLAQGHGRAVGKDFYEGQFRQGKPHGKGTYRWASTDSSYSGDFIDGVPSGRGHHRYGKKSKYPGDEYEGEVKAGKPEGNGVYRFANGDVYEGQFRNGTRHGTGLYRWANGCSYEGAFVRGERSSKSGVRCPPGQRVSMRLPRAA